MFAPANILKASEERTICQQLLGPLIVAKLIKEHGNVGSVEIWKGMTIHLPSVGPTSYHHVRAFPDGFDCHTGAFYDWVKVKDDEAGEDAYWPSKAVLLYKFEDKDYCMCWCASTPTSRDTVLETNISAVWKMGMKHGEPKLFCVDMTDVVETLYVYEHFSVQHSPFPARRTTGTPYQVQEVYDRYNWSVNYLPDNES